MLPNFCRGADEKGKTAVGREAIISMYTKLRENNAKTLDDLRPFARYGWSMDRGQALKAKEWTCEIAALAVPKPKVVVVASGSPGSSNDPIAKIMGKKRKSGGDEAVLRAATKALFT